MIQHVQAIFEHGVLRPLEPVDLQEREVVSVSIEQAAAPAAEELSDPMTPEQKQAILALLDRMERMPERSPADGLSNRDHDRIIYGIDEMIFVDTGAWFAALAPDDADHAAASEFMRRSGEQFVTTDYVLDELLTLFKSRGHFARAEDFIRDVFDRNVSRLEWTTREDFVQAWLTFQRFHDKAWSFTDCISLVVMRRLGVKTAFSFDEHFRQFGGVTVVP